MLPAFWAGLVLLLLAGSSAYAQAPAWQTAVATSQASGFNSRATATATDGNDNVYVTGVFNGTVTFGSTALTSAGNDDVFVAKWSSTTGGFMWAQRAGSTTMDEASALVVSGQNVYVTGYFSSAADFGSTTLTPVGLDNTADVFVAKLTDGGTTSSFTWAQRAGGTLGDLATSLAVSGTNIYVAGFFYSSTASFGSTTLTNTNPNPNIFSSDVFVAKLTDAGSSANFVWARQAGGTDQDFALALTVNGPNLYVAGEFLGATATFGSTTLTNVGVVSSSDAFVAKLTDEGTTGSFTWAQRAGGTGLELATSLAVSGTTVYVVGFFQSSTASFGSIPLTNTDTHNTADIFIAKLADVGTTAAFVWVRQAGGTGDDDANSIAVSGANVYVAGSFASATATFGSTVLLNAGVGSGDTFVAKLMDVGASASFTWAQSAGGRDSEETRSVAVSGKNVYVAGTFASATARFGSITLVSPGYPTTVAVAFLASLRDTEPLAMHGADLLTGVSLYPNPAFAMTTVLVPAVPGAAKATFSLIDALGRQILTRTTTLPASGLRHELNVTGIAPGVYTVQVQAGAARTVRRLTVY